MSANVPIFPLMSSTSSPALSCIRFIVSFNDSDSFAIEFRNVLHGKQ